MVEQGSQEWHEQRLGMVTASRFKDVMTNGRGTGTMGATAYSYMYDLIAEKLTGVVQDAVDNHAVRWGNDNEPQARAMYAYQTGYSVDKVGFIKHPTIEGVGGSPDGLIGVDGGVEIKCPKSSRIHFTYMEKGGVPKEYFWQVQGLLWITGREWWDFVSFDPRMPDEFQLFVHRERSDEEAHIDLERRAARFLEQMEVKLKKVRGRNAEKPV